VTISAVQLPWYHRKKGVSSVKKENLENAVGMLSEAGKRGSDIALVGETFNIRGIDVTRSYRPLADPFPGPVIERLSRVARKFRMYIVAPICAKVGKSLFNRAVIVDRGGKVCGYYDKVHLTQLEKKRGVSPGESFGIFDLDFGRVGVMICHDNSFVESARVLALMGAEIIFWPHVQGGWGEIMWDITLRSRAIDNSVIIVSASFGIEKGKAWMPGMMQGRSNIVRWDGHIVADAGRWVDIATATLDLDQKRIAFNFTREDEAPFWEDLLADRRPECYGEITRPR